MFKSNLIAGFLFLSSALYSQETRLSESVLSIAEELASDEEGADEASMFIERLSELTENPVRLNNPDEVSRLFFLSDFQIRALNDYTRKIGNIVSVYEIMNIPGFDRETAEMMAPFISLIPGKKVNWDTLRFRSSLLSNFSFKKRNESTTALGSQWKALAKYKFVAGHISGGLTTEKDPGEKFLTGNPPRPDFLSANLSYNGNGFIRRIIAGDYSAKFGQGTNINTGFRTSLSTSSSAFMASPDAIRPYTSTDENNFFRGVAADLALKNMELLIYYSKNFSDAETGLSPADGKLCIESFYSSGLHNTALLNKKKDTFSEVNYGFASSINFSKLKAGFSFSESRLSLPQMPVTDEPAEIYSYQAGNSRIFSVHYNTLVNKILTYGEVSLSPPGNFALVQGLSFRPSDRLTLNVLYRNYDPGYFSRHGKGPGVRSVTSNEHGILLNSVFEAARHLFVSAGTDLHYFPWLKYRNSSPSMGKKHEIRVKYLPSGNVAAEISYRYRMYVNDKQEDSGIPAQSVTSSNDLKGSVNYSFSDNLKAGFKISYKVVDPLGNDGMMLSQDLYYKMNKIPLALWFRYCLYNTTGWDSRLYLYENDLLYSFSVPALSGDGSRSYIMAKLELGEQAEVRIKYAITSVTETMDNYINNEEVKFQIRLWF